MQRYTTEIFSAVKQATTFFGNYKPLELDIPEFYAFIVRRLLDNTDPLEIPRGSSKTGALFDMLQLDDANPLYVYKYPSVIYLPDGDVTWSVNQYV
jgi:hypothetical protein